MDPSNMTVIEDRRVALMDTINNFSKWRVSQTKLQGKPKAGKRSTTSTSSKHSPLKKIKSPAGGDL